MLTADLKGKKAIVTGAASGIGLATAELLARSGAMVAINDIARNPKLNEEVSRLCSEGLNVIAAPGDVGDGDDARAMVTTAAETMGGLDYLVNNAGTTWGAPAEDHPRDAWDKVVALNLTAPFLLAQAAAKKAMIPAGKGRIVNIASIEGFKGHPPRMPGTIAYNTTKGGVVNMTRALAAEWGGYGITVNAIAPGYFPSKMTKGVLGTFEQDLTARTPRGQLGGDQDLKGATLLFASDASAHVTGQILIVDGGSSVI